VAADLRRLEPLNPRPDAEWLVFLKNGYKQSGASAETVTAMEDRVIQAFPHSGDAYDIVSDRWDKIHKEPEDQKDAAAWAQYDAAYKGAVKGWIAQFTESRYVQHQLWFNVIFDDTGLTEKEGLAALDDYLTEISEYQRPPYYAFISAGSFLVEHKWQPERALDLLRKAETLTEEWHARRNGDNLPGEEDKMWAENDLYQKHHMAGLVLRAAKLAGRPEEAERLKASIEGPPPKDVKFESAYWVNRARLAELEGRKIDALTYYQKGLDTREPPQPRRGKLTDVVTDEARALWKETGGTEVAWEVWRKPSAGKVQELAEGRWEKPVKPMPAFEMGDLSGKTWRIKNLEGKAVLINVWATWCGPCQAELPKLEKLYQQMKDRSDSQILTFNIDSDLGLVAPFVKDKGFTFPVLPAYSRRGAAGHGGHSAELAPGSEGRLALEPIGLRLFGCGMGRNDDREARIGEGEVVPYS
jgi:thiol-disulfide isomerase/thioredoxin